MRLADPHDLPAQLRDWPSLLRELPDLLSDLPSLLIDARDLPALGISSSNSWRLRQEKMGRFPRRVHLSPLRTAYVLVEIQALCAAHVAARDGQLSEFLAACAKRSKVPAWLANVAARLEEIDRSVKAAKARTADARAAKAAKRRTVKRRNSKAAGLAP